MQLESGTGRKIRGVFSFAFLAAAHDVLLVRNDFARFGLLTRLEVRIVEKVHGVSLVVRFSRMHFRGVGAGIPGGDVLSDGILPETEAHEDVGRHVNSVRRRGGYRALSAAGGV